MVDPRTPDTAWHCENHRIGLFTHKPRLLSSWKPASSNAKNKVSPTVLSNTSQSRPGTKTRLVWAKQIWWIFLFLGWMGFQEIPWSLLTSMSWFQVMLTPVTFPIWSTNFSSTIWRGHWNLPAWLRTTTRVSIRDEFRVRLWNVLFPRKWWCIYSLSIYNNRILM